MSEPGQLANGTFLGNVSGATAEAKANSLATYLASPASIGGTAPASGKFTSVSVAPAANTQPISVAAASTTGSSTVSLGCSVSGTLNTSGVVNGAAFFANVGNTAYGAGSTLVEYQIANTSYFKVDMIGNTILNGNFFTPAGNFWSWTNRTNLTSPADGKFQINDSSQTKTFVLNVPTNTNLGLEGVVTVCSLTTAPAGGSATAVLGMGTTPLFGVFYGSGAPTTTAAQGSLYLRTDGTGTSSRAYINNSGTAGWTAITTTA